MSRFIAIPVGQGDAFCLERDAFSVLIDGGRSRSAFPAMFQRATKKDGVDVIVCTHNDADHANGILGFLEAGLGCEEIWLPGRWLSALPDVLRPFAEVYEELLNDIAKMDTMPFVEGLQTGSLLIEAYAEYVRHGCTDYSISRAGDGWPNAYLRMLEVAEPWEVLNSQPVPWYTEEWRLAIKYYHQLGTAKVQLLWSAIDAAVRIRVIATEAIHRSIPVRWFEFNTPTPSGGVPALLPLNAREVTRLRPRVGSLLDWLALTVSNKESLVFWSPPTSDPGVLFTADSDLENVGLPSDLPCAIVTAPHHGSEANANAYRAVVAATNGLASVTWVRSDGRYQSRPGDSYRGLVSPRLCTLCQQPNGSWTKKQTVHLYSCGGAWVRHQSSQECSCQRATNGAAPASDCNDQSAARPATELRRSTHTYPHPHAKPPHQQ